MGEYVYNGKGERVQKTAGGTTTIFHYDATGLLIAESDALGNVSREYVYLNVQPLAILDPGTATGTEVVVDTEDAGTQVFGEWPTSTVVPGFLGAHYQYHAANGPSLRVR